MRLAFRELDLLETGTLQQQENLGHPDLLPRPWDPPTCTVPELRLQLWEWLEAVVAWLNQDYTWDLAGMIPTCWPHHPHLVHEIAVLADQRRRAGLATHSHALEEWHRYAIPAFSERTRGRLRAHCEEGHQPWPGRSRHNQHLSDTDTGVREDLYACDIDALTAARTSDSAPSRLGILDLETGQLRD